MSPHRPIIKTEKGQGFSLPLFYAGSGAGFLGTKAMRYQKAKKEEEPGGPSSRLTPPMGAG